MIKHHQKLKIGIIGGGNLYNLSILRGERPKTIATPYGKAFYYLAGDCPLILRHSPKKDTPPHAINHRANIYGFKKMGAESIFAFNSVGSLKKHIKPGEFLVPDDYISFNASTFYDKECKFITPELSSDARKILIQILRKLKLSFQDRGVYFQTRGPRLETKAEINLIKNYADVVGMTMASEAALSQELGLRYGSLCSIDNYAHGIAKTPLSIRQIEICQAKTAPKIEKIIRELV